jgi:Zn-finger protein
MDRLSELHETMISKIAKVQIDKIFLHSWCSICDQGFIGFWRCGENETIVLLCQTCGSLWLEQSLAGTTDCVPSQHNLTYPIPGRTVRLGDPPARWATFEEISRKGWQCHIENNPEVAYGKGKPYGRKLAFSPCIFCSEGTLGFWRCDDSGMLVLMCDECSLVRDNPALDNALAEIDVNYTGRWATRQEVAERGWHFFVHSDDGVIWRETEFALSFRDPEKEMWASSRCKACEEGLIGFWRCGEEGTIVLLCDVCGLLWRDPSLVDTRDRSASNFHPTFPILEQRVFLGSPPFRWATRAEIEAKGWGQFIEGERRELAQKP